MIWKFKARGGRIKYTSIITELYTLPKSFRSGDARVVFLKL